MACRDQKWRLDTRDTLPRIPMPWFNLKILGCIDVVVQGPERSPCSTTQDRANLRGGGGVQQYHS